MKAVGGVNHTGAFARSDEPANAPQRAMDLARDAASTDPISGRDNDASLRMPLDERCIRSLVATVLACALASCTTIIVREGQADIEVTHHFGIANVRVVPVSHALLLATQSIGAAVVVDGLVVGLSRSEVALLDDRCRLVLWHPMASNLEKALRESEHICSIPSPGGLP